MPNYDLISKGESKEVPFGTAGYVFWVALCMLHFRFFTQTTVYMFVRLVWLCQKLFQKVILSVPFLF